MQKTIIYLSNIVSLLLIGSSFHAIDALFRFITVGQIPGTNLVLSPDSMYVVLAVVFFIGVAGVLPIRFRHHAVRQYSKLQSALPKQRYASLGLFNR